MNYIKLNTIIEHRIILADNFNEDRVLKAIKLASDTGTYPVLFRADGVVGVEFLTENIHPELNLVDGTCEIKLIKNI